MHKTRVQGVGVRGPNTRAFLPMQSREELEAKPRSLREVNNEFGGEMLMDKEAFKEVPVYISLPGAIF